MVKILLDFIVKLQQFRLLPYRWSNNPLSRNGNNYLTWNLQLRRNGNKPFIKLLPISLRKTLHRRSVAYNDKEELWRLLQSKCSQRYVINSNALLETRRNI